ncbi:MAG: hypothetical protein RXO29_03615 [Desulfurococcales archaeon]
MSWRGWKGPYPGNGPWSHLPPYERPGYWYGRGWCWRTAPYGYVPPYPGAFPSTEDELRYLEDLRKYISEVVLKDLDSRIEELKKALGK